MAENRRFRGIWIPAEIWLSESLTLQEKIMLVEIDSLDNENGCFASSAHFSKFLGVGERQVQRIMKSLKDKGFISISYKYKPNSKEIESRSIKIVEKNYPRQIPAQLEQEQASVGGDIHVTRGGDKNVAEVVTFMSQGGDKNVADNNTSTNNTISNNTVKSADAPNDRIDKTFSKDLAQKVKEWIQYKKERREGYKDMGLKSLITEIKHNADKYGEQAVIDLINYCMSANYKGIIFDRLKQTKPVQKQAQAQTHQYERIGDLDEFF